VRKHRARALSPERPVLRGSAQNPDVFFQAREAANPYYRVCPAIVQNAMDKFADLTGRQYHLFDYTGAPDAERVIVIMGSGAVTVEETAEHLAGNGGKVGVLKVRLYRPFAAEQFVRALPAGVKAVAVLDRTKEPGSAGEPLYQDAVTAVSEFWEQRRPNAPRPRVIGGRYGLSSKEFTPAMVKAVFDELKKPAPKNHFTVGILDDVSHTSLDYDPEFSTEDASTVRCVFYGLGADGTVGANKNSIKIIGEHGRSGATPLYAQGYFVIDSKKSGSVTVSHLRFGPKPIRAAYLITTANFVACHQFNLLERFDVLAQAEPGAAFLLNSPYGPDEVWDRLPVDTQRQLVAKKIRFYVIDGHRVARESGMGGRVNTVMQTCFFAVSGVLPKDEAIAAIKQSIEKTYGKRGEAVVRKNFEAVDSTLANLHEVPVPAALPASNGHLGQLVMRLGAPAEAPEFVQEVTGPIIAGMGDDLPVSALPADGTFPTATSQWEKRNIALEIPVWDPDICIQCGKCVMVCPHAVIREKVYEPAHLARTGGVPETFKSAPARWKEFEGWRYTLQVAPEDCTGCALCFEVCPVKNKQETRLKAVNLAPQPPLREAERANWEFFLKLPEVDRRRLNLSQVKDSQLLRPLFEFSGACAGCGETPYLKLLSQLFGDRALIANATGCSSIYGGNLPTTPWAKNNEGRGPAWANSLFEDNAEFGLGFRLTLDKHAEQARELAQKLAGEIGEDLARELVGADQSTEAGIWEQRERVAELKRRLEERLSVNGNHQSQITNLQSLAEALLRRSVWIVGGDGWAYDIGYGGLDHVLASGRDVNVLVLDT
jgi:pyruvate-ferredoxin/flavodoxin oxidoreductase